MRKGDSSIKSFADLKGKTSAQTLTSNFGKLAKDNGADLVPTTGFDQSIQLVLDRPGGCDDQRQPVLSRLQEAQARRAGEDRRQRGRRHESGVIIKKGEPKLLAAIDKALDDMKADGTYLKISKKYFGEDVSK